MNKNDFLVLRHIEKYGINGNLNGCRDLRLSNKSLTTLVKNLFKDGLVDDFGITESGMKELSNYKVNSAIILCAGMSTRLAPLSFDVPKGLLEVKGEVLIERQIKQLHDAGIKDITLVLGFKKELFFYLGEKYGVRILINPEFATKNSSESLFLAKEYIGNSYICSSDIYFVDNPFEKYEYESFAVTEEVCLKEKGNFIQTNKNNRISSRMVSNGKGIIYKGMMYWNRCFSKEVVDLLNDKMSAGDYNQLSIQTIVFNNLSKLPPIYSYLQEQNEVFKFYYLDDLRKFDEKYINDTSNRIMKNISTSLNCLEGEIEDFRPIKEGLTNTSYVFKVNGKRYVYRHPGEGTELIIQRNNEAKSLQLAKEMGIDPTFITMNSKEGWKISSFAENCREPDYHNFEDSKLIIKKMKELHSKKIKVDWEFRPWEGAEEMETIINKKQQIVMKDFFELKNNVKKIYDSVSIDGLVDKCLCHCDTYKPNWLINKDNKNVILIDWEYAGYSDPGVDVGYYIVDAMYDYDDAKRFIKEYLGKDYTLELERHFFSYISIIAYYWFVWAMYREQCSAIMGESLYNWYYMAKKYSKYTLENYFNE